jgi:hypothetical protein
MDEINGMKRKEILPFDLESVEKAQVSLPGRQSGKVHTYSLGRRSLEVPSIQRGKLGIETGNWAL